MSTSQRLQQGRFILTSSALGVGIATSAPDSWTPLSQLSLRAIFSNADQAPPNYRSVAETLAPEKYETIAIIDGLDNIVAARLAAQDLAVLGAVSEWPDPSHIRADS